MSQQTLVRARTVRHIRIDGGRPYARFRTDYETVVPSFDREGGKTAHDSVSLSYRSRCTAPSAVMTTRQQGRHLACNQTILRRLSRERLWERFAMRLTPVDGRPDDVNG
jgi:hypothetical protein